MLIKQEYKVSMQRIHKLIPILKIICIVMLMIHLVNAHEDNKKANSNLSHYSLKERIHDLCSGHGLMHLKPLEIKSICNLFAENTTDIDLLQQAATTDKYLSQLTALIIYSNIPKEQKQKMLRESYEISLDKSKRGNDWGFTIGILIEESDILSVDELASHTKSANEYLKSVSKRYLQKKLNHNPNNKSERPSRNKTTNEKQSTKNKSIPKVNTKPEFSDDKEISKKIEKNRAIKSTSNPEGESELSGDTAESHVLPIIVGGLCIGIVILITLKRNTN